MNKKKRKKISGADLAFRIFNTIFMIAFVVITLYPVLNTLAISLNGIKLTIKTVVNLTKTFLLREIKCIAQKHVVLCRKK